jgi:hypothetical protein
MARKPLGSGSSGLGEGMTIISVEEQHIKDLLKQAILELLEERQSLFQELITEAIEDLALLNAIREGETTETVSLAAHSSPVEGKGLTRVLP